MRGLRVIGRSALVVVALAAVSRAVDTPPPAGAAGPRSTYQDNTFRFSVDAPAFATPDGGVPAAVIPVMFSGPATGKFADNVNVVVQPKSTRAAYVAETRQQFAAIGGQVVAQVDKQVSGHDAVQIEYTAAFAGRPLHFLTLAVFGDDHVYLTTCTATPDTFAAEQAAFQKCLDSFHLTPPAP